MSHPGRPGTRAPPTEVVVFRAGPADLDSATPLFDEYRQFYRQPGDRVRSRAFLAERIDRGVSVVFLAREGPLTVGFMQLYPMFASTTLERIWVLNDLFVVRPARRRGAGSLLLRRAQDFARETGAAGLLLETAVDNPAQKLYESLGWELDREFLHYEWRRR